MYLAEAKIFKGVNIFNNLYHLKLTSKLSPTKADLTPAFPKSSNTGFKTVLTFLSI